MKGYHYAGVQYGGECWCGNQEPSSSMLTQASDCNMPCPGNSSEVCGAGYRVNVYKAGEVTKDQGCKNENPLDHI